MIENFTFNIDDYSAYTEANEALNEFLYRKTLRTKLEDLPTQEVLNSFVEKVTEAFFEKFDMFPSKANRGLLANVCLLYSIKSKKSNKNREEDSFLSSRQLKTRANIEFSTLDIVLDIKMSDRIHHKARPKFTKEIEDI